jgi:hypothetical protein
MAERLSRRELFDLVWSEPLKTLCSRFGISDVALKKTCARSEIPTPERGYWARKDAGKPTLQVALPIRPPAEVLLCGDQSSVVSPGRRGDYPNFSRGFGNRLSKVDY